jgi:biotin carboxylase/acetyl-CoA carboxylase carboxyltransferase component/biotin carboxyl carrier protein
MTNNILIANRGLPALKFILSIKEWLVDVDLPTSTIKAAVDDIKLFGLVTPVDLSSRYRYIPMLDHAIYCDDDSVYTDIDKIVQYCKEYNIQQVFPGWGYLSENETFVKTLTDNGIRFIGPTYDNMTMVGNKISCNTVANQLGVPILPFSGSVQLDTLEDIEHWCDHIGYPVMLKAGNSGGGKGIRIVREKRLCHDMWREIKQEVVNPMIYATKYIENASHLEIQILGDGHSSIHLHGRDCTTQRRNQKLVEECPIQKDPSVIARIELYATKIATHIRYRGLATVEFIYDQDTGDVFILEVNPRIQVEHIITERLFGVNLIKLLYLVSNGVRLHDIPEIAKLNYNFDKHIVSVRINSENPHEDFRPTIGRIDDIDITYNQKSWGYFSVANGATISETVDSQFGHILAIGNNRQGAIRNMTTILDSLSIRGTVCTTASFLKNFLHRSVFVSNQHTTRFLDSRSRESRLLGRISPNTIPCGDFDPHNTTHATHIVVLLGMLQNAVSEFVPIEQDALLRLEQGHQYPIREANKPHQTMIVYQNTVFEYVYSTSVSNSTDKVYTIHYLGKDYVLPFSFSDKQIRIRLAESVDVKPSLYTVAVCNINESQFELLINHRRYHFVRQLSDDSKIRCPVGGKVVECMFQSGTDVDAGSVYVKIECMKMIMAFTTSRSGVLRYRIKPGETVQARQLICEYDSSSSTTNEFTTNPNIFRDFVTQTTIQDGKAESAATTIATTEIATEIATPTVAEFAVEDYPRSFSERYEILFADFGKSNGETIGSVAYLVDNRFVLYVNNLKYRNGVFSAAEDEYFFNCLRHAREQKLPFVFIASNSGAEIRIADDVKFELEPHIVDNEFRYLFLKPDKFDQYRSQVIGQYHKEFDHFEITCVRNPGVVTLDGSALLVSEMARARKEIMTITFVVNRTVGVGAYLARLSERIVQRSDSVLLLTGYQSINKVLGNELYSSNAQLGGPDVMAHNGISHKIVQTTNDGIEYIKRLLDFDSPKLTSNLARSNLPISNQSTLSSVYDIIDQDTMVETMELFAPNVTTGRCRIGGKRFGIIFPTVGDTQKTIPCDPADLSSANKILPLSPNILYPDTSYKIAKTIRDCRVEGVELFIVADWRGFSGGTRDMYDKVLDFGSMIVSELAEYDVPVTVYVPPGGQLRGGSMVVFSKSINRQNIRFYVSQSARINVLEPNATKELKYKLGDMTKYSLRYNVTNPHMMERIATHFVELNDRIDTNVTVLNRYETIVDGVTEPNELREMLTSELAARVK